MSDGLPESPLAWRWEFAGTPQAASVPVWMQPGHGRPGALHSVVLGLVRKRQAHSFNLQWAYDDVAFITEEMLECRGFADQALESHGPHQTQGRAVSAACDASRLLPRFSRSS